MTVVLIALTIVSAAVVAAGGLAWWFLSTYPDPTGNGR
jgi:hypothetical protein